MNSGGEWWEVLAVVESGMAVAVVLMVLVASIWLACEKVFQLELDLRRCHALHYALVLHSTRPLDCHAECRNQRQKHRSHVAQEPRIAPCGHEHLDPDDNGRGGGADGRYDSCKL